MSVLPQTSLSIREKADKLLTAGSVTIVCVDQRLQGWVTGDHDSYAVVREKDRWRCTCPARRKCSHIEAVERVTG